MHPQVALRPERFGALAYHFGTRRLSFLKARELSEVVQMLDSHPTARSACTAAGIGEDRLPAMTQALSTLARSGMIEERP
jgi:putative mycofactocin binding protein MftB